jgi:hypothetical protein
MESLFVWTDEAGVPVMTHFRNGDRVKKYKGGYVATGTIIGVGKTKAGEIRYMVEYDVVEGLIHVHSDSDLRLMSETEDLSCRSSF